MNCNAYGEVWVFFFFFYKRTLAAVMCARGHSRIRETRQDSAVIRHVSCRETPSFAKVPRPRLLLHLASGLYARFSKRERERKVTMRFSFRALRVSISMFALDARPAFSLSTVFLIRKNFARSDRAILRQPMQLLIAETRICVLMNSQRSRSHENFASHVLEPR